MSALKKPVSALIGVMAVLLAGMFFAVGSASAAPAARVPAGVAAVAAPPSEAAGPGSITVTVTRNADGSFTVSVTVVPGTFTGGETIIIIIHSKAQQIGSGKANADGSFSGTATIPAGFSGSHTIEAVGQSSGVTASFPIQLGGSSSGSSSAAAGGSGSGGGLSSTGVAVIGIGAVGVVLLAGGGLLMVAGRRRRPSGGHA